MWHVSIARLNRSGEVIATERWGEGTMREARSIGINTLRGVGVGESVETLRPVCLHIRRSLAPEEVGTLSAAWLAIPAQDEFSEAGGMESRL